MGIKNLSRFINDNCPQARFTIPISALKGKKIAIDAYNWIYSSMSIARKTVINSTDLYFDGMPNEMAIRKEWFQIILHFLHTWLGMGILPVFVFDGTPPPEKNETKDKRSKVKQGTKAKIEDLQTKLKNMDMFTDSRGLLNDLRKELCNYTCISSIDIELFKTILKWIGIEYMTAKGDGEKLCSMLCIEKKVAAVFSCDIDNLVYGCPLLITGFTKDYLIDKGQRVRQCKCLRLDYVLTELKINYTQFIDLCIMAGCDYNTNISQIAICKSYQLLLKHGSIERISKTMDVACLRYERCRQLFCRELSTSITTEISERDVPNPAASSSNSSSSSSSNIMSMETIYNNSNQLGLNLQDLLAENGMVVEINRLLTLRKLLPKDCFGLVEELNLEITSLPIWQEERKPIRIILDIVSND